MSIATLPTATVDDMLRWKPCGDWSEDRIREIAGDRKQWTALDVLALEQVPAQDRLWVVLRPELIPEPLLHELACRFAEQVLPIWEQEYPEDRRQREAIAAKRAWLRGEISDEELAAVGAAARAAARAAAEAAARAAARAAVGAAARAAAWDAAGATALGAAWAAAGAAAAAAAWAAAEAAAEAAARDAAWAAAADAARDAAWAAAADAARDAQVEIVREALSRPGGEEE